MADNKNNKEFNNVSDIYNRADIAHWYQSVNPGSFDYLAAMDRAGATHVVLTEEHGKKTLRPAHVGDTAHMLNGRTVTISAKTALDHFAAAENGFTIEIISNTPAPAEAAQERQPDTSRRLEEARVHLAMY